MGKYMVNVSALKLNEAATSIADVFIIQVWRVSNLDPHSGVWLFLSFPHPLIGMMTPVNSVDFRIIPGSSKTTNQP